MTRAHLFRMEATTHTAAFTAAPAVEGLPRSYAVPLVVAVTGHRDLVPAELPLI